MSTICWQAMQGAEMPTLPHSLLDVCSQVSILMQCFAEFVHVMTRSMEKFARLESCSHSMYSLSSAMPTLIASSFLHRSILLSCSVQVWYKRHGATVTQF